MNKIKLDKSLIMILLPVMALIVVCCSKDPDPGDANVASCEGCHTDYAHLQEVFTADTSAPVGGCGGDAPHYEPFDRVYLGGDGYEAYKSDPHYSSGCTSCHNGTDNTSDKNLAHSGDFLSHPSRSYVEKCGTCHSTTADHFATSIHQGTGQKRKVTLRSGKSGPTEFDQLPAHQIEGYNANCAICHGSCGNCHVVRPPAAGGGLANGHDFVRTPDMHTVCVKCHSSRGGHAYLGEGLGTVPDVHLTQEGYKCNNCHTGAELHGDGNSVEQRYAYTKLPKCQNCHSNLSISNEYHKKHIDDFNCQVCHSQNYNNCGSCHIHGEGARVPAYMGFKIGLNPIPDVKTGYKFALLRRTLAAPDNWKEYVTDAYPNFDSLPTYNYTTPHNILKRTARTEVGTGSCASKCHIRDEGGVTLNKELYLFESDLLEWEKSATSKITVDGKLPSGWPN